MTRLLRAEFTKLFTTRLWLWLLLGAIGMTALVVSLTIGLSGSAGTRTRRCRPRQDNAICSPQRLRRPRWPWSSASSR